MTMSARAKPVPTKITATDGRRSSAAHSASGMVTTIATTVIHGIFDGGMTRVLLVPHGGNHNDTICTVEVKC